MREMASTLTKLQRLENNLSFLTNVDNEADVSMIVVNGDNSVDIENTMLLQELRELNSRREEVIKLLMED